MAPLDELYRIPTARLQGSLMCAAGVWALPTAYLQYREHGLVRHALNGMPSNPWVREFT